MSVVRRAPPLCETDRVGTQNESKFSETMRPKDRADSHEIHEDADSQTSEKWMEIRARMRHGEQMKSGVWTVPPKTIFLQIGV